MRTASASLYLVVFAMASGELSGVSHAANPTCDGDVCGRPLAAPAQGSEFIPSNAKFESIQHVPLQGPFPLKDKIMAEDLWKDGPAVLLVVRRLNCPYCRSICVEALARKKEFETVGAKLYAVSAQNLGAEAFQEDIWKGEALYIDESDGLRSAMGDESYKNHWLINPTVLAKYFMGKVAKDGGFGDLTEKTKQMGGELVVGQGGIEWQRREDQVFGHSSVDDLLAAAQRAARLY